MSRFHRVHGYYELVYVPARGNPRLMELYISPMSCSFTAHVACIEAGVPVNLRHVARKTKLLDDGRDFRDLAPQGTVPVIRLPDDGLLTESAAVLQWIADQAPQKQLAPAQGTVLRYRLMEWLNFVTTELHKKLVWMIFSAKTPDSVKEWARANAGPSLDYAERHLRDHTYLVGNDFTVADIYLYWTLYVLPHGGVALDGYPALKAYMERLSARASIREALSHEGPLFLKEKAEAEAAVKVEAPLHAQAAS